MSWDTLKTTNFPFRNDSSWKPHNHWFRKLISQKPKTFQLKFIERKLNEFNSNWYRNATRLRAILMCDRASCNSFVYFNRIQFSLYDCFHSFHWHSQTELGERRSLSFFNDFDLGVCDVCVCVWQVKNSALYRNS